MSDSIPVGLCQCGCGGKTSIAPRNHRSRGWVKGQPVRFLPNHFHEGHTDSSADAEARRKAAEARSGLCECGCGEKTQLAKATATSSGDVAGMPRRFVDGHSLRVNRREWAPLAERFWQSVAKSDGCWNWTASTNSGYGQIHDGSGRQALAHRVSWLLHFGLIPHALYVLHKCDNPRCVRPDTYFWARTSTTFKTW